MKTLRFILSILLFPLSVWYAVGVALRNALFNLDILKSETSEIPTVGIGNLRMGGTGKTPHTEYLIRLLSSQQATRSEQSHGQLPLAFLSRGYGRSTKGFLLAGDTTSDSLSIGDEPAMIATKFPHLTVAVCEERLEGLHRLAELPQPPHLVLLDDVYQHRKVRPTLMLLLTEYGDPYFGDHILPFGNLREFRAGSRRADIVVVTKCPPHLSGQQREYYRSMLRLLPHQSLFFSHICYGVPEALYGDTPWRPVKELLLVTGIAHPAPLRQHLEGQCTVHHLAFPDHHDFNDADCRRIVKAFRNIGESSKAIVTTEKDAMRLRSAAANSLLQELPLFFLPITVAIDDEEAFLSTIKNFI